MISREFLTVICFSCLLGCHGQRSGEDDCSGKDSEACIEAESCQLTTSEDQAGAWYGRLGFDAGVNLTFSQLSDYGFITEEADTDSDGILTSAEFTQFLISTGRVGDDYCTVQSQPTTPAVSEENTAEDEASDDICFRTHGTDANACLNVWLFPGCCFVAQSSGRSWCMTYDESLAQECQVPDSVNFSGESTVGGNIELDISLGERGGVRRLVAASDFATDARAGLAIRGSIAEMGNVALARVNVNCESQDSSVDCAYQVSVPTEEEAERLSGVFSSTSGAQAAEVCVKHINARGLSYGVAVRTFSASVISQQDLGSDEEGQRLSHAGTTTCNCLVLAALLSILGALL